MTVITKTEFISKDASRWPYLVDCHREGCYYRVACKTLEEANREDDPINHKCPRKGPTRNNMCAAGRPDSYERTWDELDNTITEIKTSEDPAKRDSARQYAMGLAYALSRYGHFELTTVDAIRREALQRYKMRIGEIPFRNTQGYMIEKREPLLTEEQRDQLRKDVAETVARSAEGIKPRRPALTVQQEMAIKAGLAGGLPSDQLAKLYNIPVSLVDSLK